MAHYIAGTSPSSWTSTLAREIASRLGVDDFKASSGWLARWKNRYNLRKVTISGESGDVSGLTVDSWKECLTEIVKATAVKI